jgi:hypothetical protein
LKAGGQDEGKHREERCDESPEARVDLPRRVERRDRERGQVGKDLQDEHREQHVRERAPGDARRAPAVLLLMSSGAFGGLPETLLGQL